MIDIKNEITEQYGYIFEKELINEITEVGQLKQISKGETLIDTGNYIKVMPLLIDGAIKILRPDKNGDEILLYFLEKGDTCAMTLTCCLGNNKSQIKAIAETHTKIITVPIDKMEKWLSYKSWRNFVFQSYNNRLNEMLETIDTLAFMKMNERLYKYLKDKVMVNKNPQLSITHQEIAYELNTSRVVISRLLKQLENDKSIELHRNKIHILKY